MCFSDDLLQICLVAFDAAGIDLDTVDDPAQPGLSKWDRTFGDFPPHEHPEFLNRLGRDRGGRTFRSVDSVERGLGAIALGLEGGEALFQHVVEIGHTVIDELIEPTQLLLGR